MLLLLKLFSVSLLLLALLGNGQALAAEVTTPMTLVNLAAEPIDVFWINDQDNQYVNQLELPLRNGSQVVIDAYETHRFLIRFYNNRDDLQTVFIKGAHAEIVLVTVDAETNQLQTRVVTKEHQIGDQVQSAIAVCQEYDGDDLASCLADQLFDEVDRLNREKEATKKYRDAISLRLRNYTCADPTMTTSEHFHQYPFTHAGKVYDVRVMLDLTHAKIWAVEDFVTEEECRILVEHGRPRLQRATVAAEDGTSIVSENRKAQQASYNLERDTYEADPLW
jgi:hypothetical protein